MVMYYKYIYKLYKYNYYIFYIYIYINIHIVDILCYSLYSSVIVYYTIDILYNDGFAII